MQVNAVSLESGLWPAAFRAKSRFGFKDNIGSQLSAARQGFKQLEDRLKLPLPVFLSAA